MTINRNYIFRVGLALAIACLCAGCEEKGNFNWRPQPSFDVDRVSHRVLLASSTKGASYLTSYNLLAGAFKVLCTDPKWICDPAASRDGTRIVFSKIDPKDGTGHLYLSLPDGSRQVQLTSGNVFDRQPVFGNNGRYVYFLRGHDKKTIDMGGLEWGKSDLFRCGISGKPVERLTFLNAPAIEKPVITPAGIVLLGYESYDNSKMDIVIHWLSISKGASTRIKWLASYQAFALPTGTDLYYLGGTIWDPDVWVATAGRRGREVTNVRVYIQQFEVLDKHRVIVLAMPYRNDKKRISPSGDRDIDQALLQISVPSQSTKTLVSVEQLADPLNQTNGK
jgi:Tol biopolymer transport system component